MAQYFGMSPEVVIEEPVPQFKTNLSKDWLYNEIHNSRSRQIQKAYQGKLKIDAVHHSKIRQNKPLIEGKQLVSHKSVTDMLKLHALKKLRVDTSDEMDQNENFSPLKVKMQIKAASSRKFVRTKVLE